MDEDENGDAAFLAEVTGFLENCEAPLSQQEGHDTAMDDDALLLDSHRLLAETEALLSSLSAPSPPPTNVEPSFPNPRAIETIRTRSSCGNAVTKRPSIAQTLGERRHEIQSAQAAKRRLKYREKMKGELRSLQQQESALSAELLRLQRARMEAKKHQESSLALSVWRSIATRQMEGRLVAEAQHRRLETAVENRAKVIQEVGSMLHERLYGSEAALPTGNGTFEQQRTIRLEPDDTVLYDEYLQDLAGIYAQTDEVFRLCGVEDTPESSFRRELKRQFDGELEFFENLDVLLIPFDYQQTCNAMWQAMTLVYRQKYRQHYEGVTDPDNTMAAKFRLQCPGEADETVEMLVHLVMRRYVEANRLVIVWRALSEGEGEYTGMHSDETGWCVVRSLDTSASDHVELPTVMQTFIRFVPMSFDSGASGERNAAQFTKLVVSLGEEDGLEVARDDARTAACIRPVHDDDAALRHPIDGRATPSSTATSTVGAVSSSFEAPVGNALEDSTAAALRLARRENRRAKDRARRRVYLERRNRERGALRHQAVELSAKLQSLEKTKDNAELPMSVWMVIAQRQMDMVKVAKAQQRRLRVAISARTAIIEQLGGLMRNRLPDVVPKDEEADEELYRHKRIHFNASDTTIFKGYLQELDAVYSQTDAAFQQCAMDSATGQSGSFQATWKTDGVTEYFQSYDTQLLPFDYLQACRSAWTLTFTFRREEGRERYEGVEDPANTTAMKFRIAVGQTVPPLLQRIVTRRYLEPGRTVFVWRALTEGEGGFAGLHVDETGWCVIRPWTVFPKIGAILEMCIRQVPMHLGAARLKAVAMQFTDVVLSFGTEDAVEIVSKLERVLLDEALENIEC